MGRSSLAVALVMMAAAAAGVACGSNDERGTGGAQPDAAGSAVDGGGGGTDASTGGSGGGTAANESGSRVGAPCVPASEDQVHFSGFGIGISLESASPDCGGGICLSYEFIGRVSCPYGQTQEEIDTLDPSDPARCRAPRTGEPIIVPVQAQRVNRPPEDAVICTCRCEGPQPDADYCTCPAGMECRHLVDDLGFEQGADLVGSYCVKPEYNPDELEVGLRCEKDSTDPATDCGNNRQNP